MRMSLPDRLAEIRARLMGSKVYPESAHQRWYGEDIPYLLDLVAAGARREGALRTLIEDYVLAQREWWLPHRSPEIAAEALTNATKAFSALCEVADAGGRIEDRRAALSASPADPPENIDGMREAIDDLAIGLAIFGHNTEHDHGFDEVIVRARGYMQKFNTPGSADLPPELAPADPSEEAKE